MTRVLIATHVPYWQRANGAHQRIRALIRYLVGEGDEVSVYFSGTATINRLGAIVPVFTQSDFISRRSKSIRIFYRSVGWVTQLRDILKSNFLSPRKRSKHLTWHDFVSEVERAAFLKLVEQNKLRYF